MAYLSTGGSFGAIKPTERDFFTFDFTKRIGKTGNIATVAWDCIVSPLSPVAITDDLPQNHILEVLALAATGTQITQTTALCGDFMDQHIYTLSATATLDDGRVLSLSGDIECQTVSPADQYLTVEQFRDDFPAFADADHFPDEEIQFWINQAIAPPNMSPAINQCRWGQFYQLGLELWVAHNLAVQDMMIQRAGVPGSGGGPGTYSTFVGSGVPASKSVNGVSISYDNQIGMEKDAGWWGSTPWGNQFLYYLRLAGAAPIHLIGPPG